LFNGRGGEGSRAVGAGGVVVREGVVHGVPEVRGGVVRILGEMKGAHASNELNLLLCEYKESPAKAPAVMKKLSTSPPTQWTFSSPSTSSSTRSVPSNSRDLASVRPGSHMSCTIGTSRCWRKWRASGRSWSWWVTLVGRSIIGAALHGCAADGDESHADLPDVECDGGGGKTGLLHRSDRAAEPVVGPREEHG
jgi:hypothetical protein